MGDGGCEFGDVPAGQDEPGSVTRSEARMATARSSDVEGEGAGLALRGAVRAAGVSRAVRGRGGAGARPPGTS